MPESPWTVRTPRKSAPLADLRNHSGHTKSAAQLRNAGKPALAVNRQSRMPDTTWTHQSEGYKRIIRERIL
jgi:hypothetical protein